MRIASGHLERDNYFMWTPFEVLKYELETRSKGRIKVELYSQTMGKPSAAIIEEVRDGLVEAWAMSIGHVATIYPPIQVLYLPYLFTNREIAWEVLDGPFGQRLIDDMAAKTGLRPLYWIENGGFRHYSNNKHAIHSPADMEGLRIRTMETPLHMKIVSDLGGHPVPVPWSQLYNSIESGLVDGQENAISSFLVPHLEDVQKFIILDGHVYGVYTVLMNNDWYMSLPDDLREILNQAKRISATVSRGLSLSNQLAGLRYLQTKGVEVYAPSEEELDEFRKLTQKSAVAWLNENIGAKWVHGVIDATKAAEEKLGYTRRDLDVKEVTE
jgi:tripartite ATP-independent transporter DctP family solute receptor